MKKGVVVEVTKNKVVVLTQDGQFLKTRKKHHDYSIGEEISFSDQTESSPFSFLSLLTKGKLAVTLASLFIIFAVVSMFILPENNDAYASVSIDINPSLELTLNKKMNVIETYAFNGEGDQLLSHLDWQGKPIETVVDLILLESKKQGFLTSGNEVLFATTIFTSDVNKELMNNFSTKLLNFEQTHEIQVSAFESDIAVHEEAKNENISVGKYGLMVASAAVGHQLALSEVKSTRVSELSKKVGSVKEVVGEKVTKQQLENWRASAPPGLQKKDENHPGVRNSGQKKGTTTEERKKEKQEEKKPKKNNKDERTEKENKQNNGNGNNKKNNEHPSNKGHGMKEKKSNQGGNNRPNDNSRGQGQGQQMKEKNNSNAPGQVRPGNKPSNNPSNKGPENRGPQNNKGSQNNRGPQ